MISPTIPTDEAERLTSLYALEVLDTPGEARFDRIVKMARHVLGVPIAYIAMIDSDRQWFKAKSGLCDILSQTSRDDSFCGHTILSDDPLIVPDALEDERFFDNPMVVGEPYVRFYAGYPLKSAQGHNVATLCVADISPRPFGDEQVRTLGHLAELAEQELNMVGVIAAQKELLETRNALIASQKQLSRELAEAAVYVRSFLPERLVGLDDAIRVDYQFLESSQLGGDLLGYETIDDDHLAIWLLDVTGHGVGATLLSISVGNTLRNGTLRADPREPARVLEELNLAFPMERNNNKFFTIWYGVYQKSTRTLRYTAGGHHPALLLLPEGKAHKLGSPGLMVGAVPDAAYETESVHVPEQARLYLFSDGLYEVRGGKEDRLLGLDDVYQIIGRPHPRETTRIEHVVETVRRYQGPDRGFLDDVSILEVEFAM
ncbi:MAG: PP2C family protein-serine/threonine phosphatase [Phycisphaerales bacterium JB063]